MKILCLWSHIQMIEAVFLFGCWISSNFSRYLQLLDAIFEKVKQNSLSTKRFFLTTREKILWFQNFGNWLWSQTHITSQYVVETNAFIVWTHGLTFGWVALMPLGAAILAQNIYTPNMKWWVFYFGICLFGQYWTASIQRLVVMVIKGDVTINWTDYFIWQTRQGSIKTKPF